MGRKKKFHNLKILLIGAALIGAGWFGADYYNSFSKTKEVSKPLQEEQAKVDEPASKPVAKEEVSNDGPQFVLETYRNDKYGFELQYPVLKNGNQQCPKLQEEADGFSLGIFNFSVYDTDGKPLADFISNQLEGMNVDTRTALAVAGQPAARIDYSTMNMASGSSVFLEHGGKFFDFGMLVSTAPSDCDGQADYEDKVYQSVISSLKFNN